MMQNGFRRIALAQGLLPERLPPRELPASVETSEVPPRAPANAPGTQAEAWDSGVEAWAAGPV